MVQQTVTKQVFIPTPLSPMPVSPLVSDSGEDESAENGNGEENITSTTISGVPTASESSDEEGTTSCDETDEDVLKALIQKFVSKDKDEISATNLDSNEKRGNHGNQNRRQPLAHSVEYWSMGRRGKPKNLIKKYSRNTSEKAQSYNRYSAPGNPVQCSTFTTYPVSPVYASSQASQNFVGYHQVQPFVQYPEVNLNNQNVMVYSNPNLPMMTQQPYSSYQGFPQVQVPLQVFPPATTGVPSQLNSNVFIASGQTTQPTQFIPVPTSPIPTYIPQGPTAVGAPVTSYVGYFPTASYDPIQPVPYYHHGAPVYYQSPQPQLIHFPVVAPSYQPYSVVTSGSYSMQQSGCPPLQVLENLVPVPNVGVEPSLVDLSSSAAINGQGLNAETQPEPDTTTPNDENLDTTNNSISLPTSPNEGSNSEVEQYNASWNVPRFFLSQPNSPLVSSSSETYSNVVLAASFTPTQTSQTELEEVVSSTTSSGYNSMAASPSVLENGHVTPPGPDTPVPQQLIAVNANPEYSSPNNLILANNMFGGFETYFEKMGFNVKSWNSNDSVMVGTNMIPVFPPSTQDIIYSGTFVILVYSKMDGNSHVITYNSQDVPYVASALDLQIQQYMTVNSNILCYNYYVPPRTSDDDYFGGQITMWQMKMSHYFNQFNPHSWKMHGVPELFNLEEVTKGHVDTVGEFHIVSKLRFCCRTCKTPWTSKKGTIVFKFCLNNTFQRGWILMRIFGQICMKDDCSDWFFQNPACYPEEIDRAMKKLSEYIGLKCYGIAVNVESFAECFKSIRKVKVHGGKGREKNVPTPHKQEFCQACLNGVCKNLYIAPQQATKSQQS